MECDACGSTSVEVVFVEVPCHCCHGQQGGCACCFGSGKEEAFDHYECQECGNTWT